MCSRKSAPALLARLVHDLLGNGLFQVDLFGIAGVADIEGRDDDLQLVVQDGKMLAHDDLQMLLFQLDRFYVEVVFKKTTDEAVGARSFENTDELAPYLETIDLSELFEAQ